MAVETQIVVNPQQLAEATRLLADIPQGLPRAITRAVNTVATSARAEIVRRVGARINVRQKDIREATVLQRANFSNLTATVRVMGGRITLYRYGARWSRSQPGASYQIRRAGGRVTAPQTFIAEMDSAHRGVFKRTGEFKIMRRGRYAGKRREMIQEKAGPSIPEAILGTRGPGIEELSKEVLDRKYAEKLAQKVDEQIGLLIERRGAGRAGT